MPSIKKGEMTGLKKRLQTKKILDIPAINELSKLLRQIDSIKYSLIEFNISLKGETSGNKIPYI